MIKLLVHFSVLFFSLPTVLFAQEDSIETGGKDVFDLSIEEILNTEIKSSSLTEVKNGLPASDLVTITSQDIELSGARSLDELLEIYVPGFTMMYKGNTGNSIGIRGIISDRNTKLLLLVNGKIMNDRSLLGATSERFLSMLGDINRIEVLQSPQSSLYGPGAISGVVHIFTKNGETPGPSNEVQINQGLVDQFTNLQLRHSNKVNNDLSYLVYYGGDRSGGVSQDQSSTKFSVNEVDGDGDTIIANRAISYPIKNLNSFDEFRHKIHAQIDYKGLSTWVRYTKGGMNFSSVQQDVLNRPSIQVDTSELKYNHVTVFTEYKKSWGKWGVEARGSFDKYDNYMKKVTIDKITKPRGTSVTSYSEEEIYGRLLLKYTTKKLAIAIGPAVSYETFGLPAFEEDEKWKISGVVHSRRRNSPSDSVQEYGSTWSTTMLSGIGELQYSIVDNLSFFAGVRVDNHTYTSNMVSPKLALVYRFPTKHLLRFQYSKSNRRAEDGDLRAQYLNAGKKEVGEIESINYYELSSDVYLSEKLILKPNVYYGDYDIIAWNDAPQILIAEGLGNLRYWGTEVSLIYKAKKSFVRISHNFVRPLDFRLNRERKKNNISASVYGYGNSLHNYPSHLTKMYYQYQINEKMAIQPSLQAVWYMVGAEDAGSYAQDSLNRNQSISYVYNDQSNEAFKPSVYLHLGYSYEIINGLTASAYIYNVLGLIDENLNKRQEFQRVSHYRIQPTSFSFKLSYKFY